jgi:hypothetical protein
MKRGFSRQTFERSQSIKFNQTPSSGSRVPCGQTNGRAGGRADMTKLTVAFRSFANAPKNRQSQLRLTASGCIIYCNMFWLLQKAIIRECKIVKEMYYHIYHIKKLFFCAVDIRTFTVLGVSVLGAETKYGRDKV